MTEIRRHFSILIRQYSAEIGTKRLAQMTGAPLSTVYRWTQGDMPAIDKLADIEKAIPGFIGELYGLKLPAPFHVERLRLPDDAPVPGCDQLFAPKPLLGPINREAGPASWTSVLAIDGEDVSLLHTAPPEGIFEAAPQMIGVNVMSWLDHKYASLTKAHMLEAAREPTHYDIQCSLYGKAVHYRRLAYKVAPGIIVTRSEKVAA